MAARLVGPFGKAVRSVKRYYGLGKRYSVSRRWARGHVRLESVARSRIYGRGISDEILRKLAHQAKRASQLNRAATRTWRRYGLRRSAPILGAGVGVGLAARRKVHRKKRKGKA